MHTFLSSLLGFGISGYLLTAYCPDPSTVSSELLPTAYNKAYYIWFYFAGIGLVAAISLYIYGKVTTTIDKKKALTA